MNKLSKLFYDKANLRISLILSLIWLFYLVLFFVPYSSTFSVANSEVQSLGTSFGFDSVMVMEFLEIRSEDQIRSYIGLLLNWDILFAILYGAMYVAWISTLFKSMEAKIGKLNLIPLVQVLFDIAENLTLATLCKHYLDAKLIDPNLVKAASLFTVCKWFVAGLVILMIFYGLLLSVFKRFAKR